MNITIIGAGNGGQAMAGHFAMLGHKVSLYNRTAEKIKEIAIHKSIILNEAIQGIGHLHCVTSDLSLSIDQAELIMITTTADAHRDLAIQLGPLVKDEQMIILNPGRTLGAFEFGTTIRKLTNKKIYIAEAQSLIYACRIERPRQVSVFGIKDKVLLSAYPHAETTHVIHKANSVYRCFVEADNILQTSLENIGAMLHPAVILFNAATIERGQPFYFYNDITPAVARFLEQIDHERLHIGKAFGIQLKTISDWISYAYTGINGNSLSEKIKNNPAYYKILAPQSIHSRLLLEDIPTGILPLIELGKLAGIKTPLLDSILHICEALLGIKFNDKGRTFKNLGIEGINKDEFLSLL